VDLYLGRGNFSIGLKENNQRFEKWYHMNIKYYSPVDNLPEIKSIWQGLYDPEKDSYYISWGWIETWFATLPADVEISFYVVVKNNTPCLAFFIGGPVQTSDKLLPTSRITLNSSGIKKYDNCLMVEYNSMVGQLSNRDFQVVLKELPLHWEEFSFPGLDMDNFPGIILDHQLQPYKKVITRDDRSCFVDLDKARQKDGGYVSLLSKNTRYQARRGKRLYEKHGDISLREAATREEALDYFESLLALHLKTWQERGKTSSLESSYYCDFHRQLIKNRFHSGEIQLLRISCGSEPIGYLYNFVQNKKIYFAQNGFSYPKNPKMKPGIISHVEAIEYNISLGNRVYDFLAGDTQYKKSLSTDSNKMQWIILQKPTFKLQIIQTIEEKARWFKKRYLSGKK
jgi:hypothetical protein